MVSRNWLQPLGLMLAAAWLAWWMSGPRRAASPAVLADAVPRAAAPAAAGAYLGSSSCAAAPCHGGPYDPERPAWNWAHAVWRADDPHARAFDDLLSPRGRQIAERFFAAEPEARAAQDQRCLACHLTPQTSDAVASSEGVGCESCHGPSQHWRNEHYLPGWRDNRIATGFYDLRKPAERAKSCVACHVGAPDRQVGHDLIAAGHPPLRFELGAYHEQLPKHWDATQDKSRHPQFEARLWLAGQMESSRAALELLISRAKNHNAVWPELAEFDCESCHHRLNSPAWRQSRLTSPLDPPTRLVGQPLWGTWYFPPRIVTAAHTLLQPPPDRWRLAAMRLDSLRIELARLKPADEKMVSLAQALLDDWSERSQSLESHAAWESKDAWLTLQQRLLAGTGSVHDQTWSAAAQRWLALAAIEQTLALPEVSQAERSARAEQLRAILAQLADPATFDPHALPWETLGSPAAR